MPSTHTDTLFRLRIVPSSVAARQRLYAHLEAHDHLATATDLPDGSVEISGPACCADEITDVAREIARVVGLLCEPR